MSHKKKKFEDQKQLFKSSSNWKQNKPFRKNKLDADSFKEDQKEFIKTIKLINTANIQK